MDAHTESCALHFTAEVIAEMQAHIASHGGNEIFFVAGREVDEGLFDRVDVLCLGNRGAVAALLERPQPGQVVIHNHPSGKLVPSDPDINLAGHYGNNNVGFFIINNGVTELCPVVRPFVVPKRKNITPDEISAVLGEGGLLSELLPGYEPRPQQIEMANLIGESFNTKRIALIEAGTGTGKSLAYLIPAALFALGHQERVLIATHTINLQEQLSQKDIPLLKKLRGMDIEAAVLKGRSNYLCLRKLKDVAATPDLVDESEKQAVEDVSRWARRTQEGTRSDLPLKLPDGFWPNMAADADDCNRVKCPDYDDCFYYKARKAAASAQLLIVNHHLLLADLFVRAEMKDYKRSVILPASTRVILDEAHHLEDVATSFGSGQITSRGMVRILGRLYRVNKRRRREVGSLIALLTSLDKRGGQDAKELYNFVKDKLVREVDDLKALIRGHLLSVSIAIEGYAARTGERQVRITSAFEAQSIWQDDIQPTLQDLNRAMAAVVKTLGKVLTKLEEKGLEDDRDFQGLMLDIQAVRTKMMARVRNLSDFLEGDANLVRWLEVDARKSKKVGAKICLSPIDVSGLLHDRIFKPLDTVVLTSATLCTDQSFDYQRARIGLSDAPPPLAEADAPGRDIEGRLSLLRIQSPFDLPQQVFAGVPQDIALGGGAGHQALIAWLEAGLGITRGSAFVLFTSYRALDQVYEGIRQRGNTPYRLLKQGVAPRTTLLERFRKDKTSVLFGADSFWEGVDVQGESLRLVVLTKLPFRVPSEPVYAARAEALKAAGGDPFMELSLPQAILRFKQGFGRLIRHRQDWGAVLITDPRLYTKRYGRKFMRTLPGVEFKHDRGDRILEDMRAFFEKRG